MDLNLSGKVVFIAGSTRGIGLATARAFLAENCRVVISGRGPLDLKEAQRALEAEFGRDTLMAAQGDLRDAAVIDIVLASVNERWGRVDCLVANVGSGRGHGGWSIEESEWERVFEENFASAYRLVQQALPSMSPATGASIVIVASIAGLESTPAPLAYSAAKASLINYAKNLSRQLGPMNIRVNCVAPGNIIFPGGSWETHLMERHDEVMNLIEAEVPLRRFGRPEEIADLLLFLSSDRAGFITGSCVVVDGGQTRSI